MTLNYVKMHCRWNTCPQDGMQTAESLLYSRLVRQIKQANIIAIYYVYMKYFLVKYQQLTMFSTISYVVVMGVMFVVEDHVDENCLVNDSEMKLTKSYDDEILLYTFQFVASSRMRRKKLKTSTTWKIERESNIARRRANSLLPPKFHTKH